MSLEDLSAYSGDDLHIRQLIEKASLVAQLQQHPGWAAIEDYILTRAHKNEEALVVGNAKTYDEYRYRVGWLAGATYFRHALQGMENTIRDEIAGRSILDDGMPDYDPENPAE